MQPWIVIKPVMLTGRGFWDPNLVFGNTKFFDGWEGFSGNEHQHDADEIFSLFTSLFTTVQELSGIFTTSSAPLFPVFTVFLKNDNIDLEDMTTLLHDSLTLHLSHSALFIKIKWFFGQILDLTTFKMIWENGRRLLKLIIQNVMIFQSF